MVSDAYRKEVAHRVRKLAWGWSMYGIPEPIPAMCELMEALGVMSLPVCEAMQQIADLIDPEGDDVFGGGDEWCWDRS